MAHWSSVLNIDILYLVNFSLQEAIRDVHVKGIMYRAVEADIGNVKALLLGFNLYFHYRIFFILVGI